jgi:class 3 adenylate cyclase
VATARPHEERKLATVLFADLVGSTALAETADPERVRALLERYFAAMAGEITLAGGTVEKFIGDAVVAVFGAPVAQEDHAERALHVALAMRRRLADAFAEELELRIGVNTGEVVVGEPRAGGWFVSGDAVNVGARLEQAAATGEILVGERTVAAARGAFTFGDERTVAAKGKQDGVLCRPLEGAVAQARPRGVGGLETAFVGRAAELEHLQAAYRDAVATGRPRLVSVVGDAGVGKTRLAREFWAWLGTQSPEPTRRTGRCLSYGQGITYWPLAEVLREHFASRADDPPDVLGWTLGLAVAPGLHPLVARERLHDAWLGFLADLVAERPAALLIEDVHWAEADLLDLLEGIVRNVPGPLFVITTARPELLDIRPGWAADAAVASRLQLAALSGADSDRLLAALLGARLPATLRDALGERAEGNPFYLEELVATLVDRGWSPTALPPDFRVPDSVQAVLAARIDLLPEAEKAALQAAAVIGRTFWSGPVYELVEGLQPDLSLLEERDFIRRRQASSVAGEREYVIKHALTREVAYESLPKAIRARHHAAVAAWIERAGAGDEQAALLAFHYAQAVRPADVDLAWPGDDERVDELRQSAVTWSWRAAELAIGRYEIEDGIALLRQAVELEARPERQAELWREIASANAMMFDGESMRASAEHAIALTGPSADLYAMLALQTARRSGMWRKRPDRPTVDGWIDRGLELAGPDSRAHADCLAAVALWRKDDEAARRLLELAERLDDDALRSNALAALTDVALVNGDLTAAVGWLDRRLALLPRLSDPDDRHFALMTATSLSILMGRMPEAEERAAAMLEMVSGLTAHHRVHGVERTVMVAMLNGRWDQIGEMTADAEHAVDENRAAPCTGNCSALLYCAIASAARGDLAEAERLAATGRAYERDGSREYHADGWLRLMLAFGDLQGAEELIADLGLLEPHDRLHQPDTPAAMLDALVALSAFDRIEDAAPRWLRPGTYAEPFALRALGVARGDSGLLSEAAGRFRAIGLEWRAAETERLGG